jgi:cytochrome b pre-mRNA-processing protein 3
MFQRLFGRERQANRAITEALYGEIVAAARQPRFYSEWKVPDTPLGRFEMLSLMMFVFQHRLHGEKGASPEIAQVLIDEFFKDVEHSLRELGISDVGVPKRMKKLARMYYGRTAAYADALDRDDQPALAAALTRNVYPDANVWPDPGGWLESQHLAAYVMRVRQALASQASEAICAGRISFPPASGDDNAA